VQKEIEKVQKSTDRLFQKELNRTTTVIAFVDSIKTAAACSQQSGGLASTTSDRLNLYFEHRRAFMELSKIETDLLEKAYKLMSNNQNKYHPESETAISDFENKYGSIPPDYRYILKEFGGCHFCDPWIFTLKELTHAVISGYEHTNIVSSDNAFPVGGLGDGSIVCIMKETGAIAILPHDVYIETLEDLEIIADSFKDLILDLATQFIELGDIMQRWR